MSKYDSGNNIIHVWGYWCFNIHLHVWGYVCSNKCLVAHIGTLQRALDIRYNSHLLITKSLYKTYGDTKTPYMWNTKWKLYENKSLPNRWLPSTPIKKLTTKTNIKFYFFKNFLMWSMENSFVNILELWSFIYVFIVYSG